MARGHPQHGVGQKTQEEVEGIITNKVKGGMVVNIDSCLCFLPGSQISDKPLKDISHLMNEPQKFALIKLDKINRKKEEFRSTIFGKLIQVNDLSKGKYIPPPKDLIFDDQDILGQDIKLEHLEELTKSGILGNYIYQDGYDFDVIFRAYDDGIAFRYDVKNSSYNKYITITDEITQFNVQEQASAWWTPAYGPNRYEELYKKTKINEIDTSHTPFTFKYENGIHLSIHEASLTNYSSMQLYYQKQNGLVVDLAPWNNGDKVRTEIPFVTPWRTIMITNSAKELIQSNLILNCNEPIAIDDVSWLKPVKYIGIWWGMITGKWTWDEGFRHGATNERSKKYIDFAAKHGFDEVLIEGWASGWQGLFP